MKNVKNAGFTLVELVIVIAIIAILAGATVPLYIRYVGRSRETVCLTNMNEAMNDFNVESALREGAADSGALMDGIMQEMGASVGTGHAYTGLCPAGGTTTLVVGADGTVTLTCTKHSGNAAAGFASTLISRMLASDTELTRQANNSTQSLKDYLAPGKRLDSEATAAVTGSSTSFTSIVSDKLKSVVPQNQSWRISNDGTASDAVYTLYVTAAKLTSGDVGSKVDAVKYTYDKNGKLTGTETVKVSVISQNGGKGTYPAIKP